MAQVEAIIFEEYRPGYTTGKEIERIPFNTIKAALEHFEQERGEKLNWWEIKDKRISLPNNGQWRRWATIVKK